MKAYVYGANGAEITDVARPSPKGTQVLVKVHACGLNRADLGMTKGHVHGSAGGVGTVLGIEWAGEVAELGPDAKGVKIGDKIMGSGGAAFAAHLPGSVQIVLGVALFFAPGYLWSEAILSQRLTATERLLTTAGLSLILPILGGFLFYALRISLLRPDQTT